jgi:hypothetical protein
LVVKGVHIWRLEKRVPMPPHITVALVVGKDEEDVGPFCVRMVYCDQGSEDC